MHLAAWDELVAANPVLGELEPEIEALIVNRLGEPPRHAIVPIDRCYELVGMIKSRWEGISGGSAIDDAVAEFFARWTRRRARELGPEAGPAAAAACRRPSTPEFAVLGLELVEDAAAPTLRFRLGVSEPTSARSSRSR